MNDYSNIFLRTITLRTTVGVPLDDLVFRFVTPSNYPLKCVYPRIVQPSACTALNIIYTFVEWSCIAERIIASGRELSTSTNIRYDFEHRLLPILNPRHDESSKCFQDFERLMGHQSIVKIFSHYLNFFFYVLVMMRHTDKSSKSYHASVFVHVYFGINFEITDVLKLFTNRCFIRVL